MASNTKDLAADALTGPLVGDEPANKSTTPQAEEIDPYLVTFQTPFDADDPITWPSSRKWAVTNVLSATGFNRIMVSTIMAPALPALARELHMSTTESVMSLSIYVLATALGPLLIGPLSEMYGRQVVRE